MNDKSEFTRRDPYQLETVTRACELLKCFKANDEWVKLSEIAKRARMNKTIAFRLAYTLSKQGLMKRSTIHGYKSNIRIAGETAFRVGYAAQADNAPFSVAVTAGLLSAAARENLELIVLDNHLSVSKALRNAHQLISEHVSLAILFQTYEKIAPTISALFREANIPLIALDIPHPGATFFGADNYRIGLLAGRVLGRWAKQHWEGEVEHILLLEFDAAGPVPQLRTTGAEAGIRETISHTRATAVRLQTGNEFLSAIEAVRKYLRRVGTPKKTLIVGINDAVVLGALRSFDEMGKSAQCAAVSIGALPEAILELRRKGSRLIGSIALFPERYGVEIARLAVDILHKRHVPPAVYAHHELITPENVDNLYPAALSN